MQPDEKILGRRLSFEKAMQVISDAIKGGEVKYINCSFASHKREVYGIRCIEIDNAQAASELDFLREDFKGEKDALCTIFIVENEQLLCLDFVKKKPKTQKPVIADRT